MNTLLNDFKFMKYMDKSLQTRRSFSLVIIQTISRGKSCYFKNDFTMIFIEIWAQGAI